MHSTISPADKRCIFIGGKQFGVNCLKQLLKHGVVLLLVIPNMDDNGTATWHDSLIKFAAKNNLHSIYRGRLRDPNTIKKIKEVFPEIIFCIGATQIVPEEVIKIAKLGILNIHPAMLPKYRGRYSTVHAIFNDEKKTGVTLHWMDKGIDSGPIINQREITISDTDTAKSLYNKVTKLSERLFIDFIDLWLSGRQISSVPQDEKEATYYPKSLPNNGHIDWSWSGRKIYNFIRAMTFEPFPPPSFKIGNKEMVIVDKKYLKKSYRATNATRLSKKDIIRIIDKYHTDLLSKTV